MSSHIQLHGQKDNISKKIDKQTHTYIERHRKHMYKQTNNYIHSATETTKYVKYK